MLNGELGELGQVDAPGALLCPAPELTYIQPMPGRSGFPPETS